jgi:hypothetical protein
MRRLSLCPACTACPEVEIDGREVRIEEKDNLVRLTADEWDVLVRAIQNGDLAEIGDM